MLLAKPYVIISQYFFFKPVQTVVDAFILTAGQVIMNDHKS